MSDNDDLTRVHEAMEAAIRQQVPQARTVEAYKPGAGVIKTPAVLLEAIEIKPGGKLSGGRLAIKVEFAAHCCLSVQTDNVELEVRNFAVKMLQVVHKNIWGLDGVAEPPQELAAYQGMFKPDDDGFDSWVVSWEQTFHLGDGWSEKDFLPRDVFIGEAPRIGKDHQDEYRQVAP